MSPFGLVVIDPFGCGAIMTKIVCDGVRHDAVVWSNGMTDKEIGEIWTEK
jgi:hypothetical protein